MEKIRARVQATKRVFIHNDLSNAAFHFKKSVEAKIKDPNAIGITFDYMAMAIMLAFTFEAKINFMGWKFIQDWKEFQPFPEKVKQVYTALKMSPDTTKRPYSSLENMKRFRDMVAHGKPQVIERDEVVVMKAEDLDRHVDLSGEWERACAPELVMQAYEDLDTVWKEMLTKSGLQLWDTMTTGDGGISFIVKVIEADEIGTPSPSIERI
jgi:hypothetical protein